MANLEKINPNEKLRTSYPKINAAIEASGKADTNALQSLSNSQQAIKKADEAKTKADETQVQLNNIIIESGTSDAEVIQARGGAPVLNERLNGLDVQLAEIAQVPSNDLQVFLDSIVDGSTVKLKNQTYDLFGEVLYLTNKNNVVLDLTGAHFIQHYHGFGVLDISNCKNVRIINGVVEGSGNFPPQTVTGSTVNNEKTQYINDWGKVKNGEKITTTYNNGQLGSAGIGVLINHSNENIVVEKVEAYNFNYSGIGVGFMGTEASGLNKNVTVKDCYSHDNFDNGFQVMNVDGFDFDNVRSENNGHPDSLLTHEIANPGYGISCRNSVSLPINGRIKDSMFRGNKRKGIDAHSGQDITIINNDVIDCFMYGIALTRFNGDVRDFRIINNRIVNSANIKDGVALLIDSSGYNLVENNIVKDSALVGTESSAIYFQSADGFAHKNTIINSGTKACLRAYPINLLKLKDNTIITTASLPKIFVNIVAESSPNLRVDIKDNIINCDNGDGMILIDLKNGTVSGNYVKNNINSIQNCTLNFTDDNVGLKGEMKTNAKYASPMISILKVTITNGVITFTDLNGIVSSVVDHTKGMTINLKTNFVLKGLSYMPNSTGNSSFTNVCVRDFYNQSVNIALGNTTDVFGVPASAVSSFNGMFVLLTV